MGFIQAFIRQVRAWAGKPDLEISLGKSQRKIPFSEVRHFFRETILEDFFKGFKITRRLWAFGAFGRLGLGAILSNTIATAVLVADRTLIPAFGQQSSLILLGLVISLVGLALAWAFAMSAAVHFSLPVYAIICVNITWYLLLIGGSIHATPWFALPVLWMAWIGFWLGLASDSRGRWIWLGLISLGAGYLVYTPFGLTRLIPTEFNILARLGLGVLLFFIFWGTFNLLGKKTKRISFASPPTDKIAFWGTLICAFLFFGASALSDLLLTSQNLFLAADSLLAPLSIFWMWLGGNFFNGGASIGKWASKISIAVLTKRVMRIVMPAAWLIAAFAGWIAVGNLPQFAYGWGFVRRLADWGVSLEFPEYYTIRDFVFVCIAILVVFILLHLFKRSSDEKMVILNGTWIAAYFALLAYYKSFLAVLDSKDVHTLTLWTGIVLVGGILWELAKGGANFLETDREGRSIFAYLSVLLFMLSVCTVSMGAGSAELIVEYASFYAIGIICLGFPMAIHDVIPALIEYQPVKGVQLLVLFGLGALSAVCALLINPYPSIHLALVPLIWCALFIFAGKRLARLEFSLDGVTAGFALGLGFAAFWIFPQLIPVPFVSFLNQIQFNYLSLPLGRGILYEHKFLFFLLSMIAGGAVGSGFGTKHGKWVRGLAAVTGAVILGFGAVYI